MSRHVERYFFVNSCRLYPCLYHGVIPACIEYQNDLAKLLERKKACGAFESALEERLLDKVSKLTTALISKLDALEASIEKAETVEGTIEHAKFWREGVFAAMLELREVVDNLEACVGKKYWPFPSYGEMLFSV